VPTNRPRSSTKPGSRYGGGIHGGPRPPVSYGVVDAALLHSAITAVTNAGDAVTLGRTSEGGAYYVGVLAEGQLEKFYLDSLDDLSACLQQLVEVGNALIQ
jgi:hypothetical protein